MTNEVPSAPDLLIDLIRFDTTNPPGNEEACIAYLEKRIRQSGLDTQRLAKDPARPNLLTRLPGRGLAPPLLLYGHVDVVTADPREWTHPPFDGVKEDGWIWGRGALDMKGAVAMMTSAVLHAATRDEPPAGDILLLCLSDEEAGARFGARFLVEEHPELFEGIRYAIGEFGGVPLRVAGETFFAIQVAEKQPCWLQATIRGPAGHGAKPMRGGAMAKLGQALQRLDQKRLPVHISPVVRRMVDTLATHLPFPKSLVLRLLLRRQLTDRVLSVLGEPGESLEALFRNTANATSVRGGEKPNVIPNEVVLGLDGRILPGIPVETFVEELRAILGSDAEVDVRLHDPAPTETDFGMFDLLGEILIGQEPTAVPLPLLLPGSTDARFLSSLGIQTYGFTPMNLPTEFDFFSTIHGADERVPVEALKFGATAIGKLLARYGESV